MTPKAGYSTPMLHVTEIERSIAFYELLGYSLVDDDRRKPLSWARLECQGGAVAFLRAERPIEPARQGVLLYLYTPDLASLRESLLAHAVEAGPIRYPGYMPSGMISFRDPDGYAVEIGHWGEKEQAAWQKRLSIPLKERT